MEFAAHFVAGARGAVILIALLVIIGLYPSIMLDMIKANVELFLRGRL